MAEPAPFAVRARNPDVLSCIANLSNDEVFTPPELANEMLNAVAVAWADAHGGAKIWADKSVTFLDPFTKSGVFLREIVKRLTAGLADEIPDLRERVNHILANQVFGIGITRLTCLLARRSVYCSKWANGEHSIGRDVFDDEDGNIWFESMQHTWTNGKCEFCGASQESFDREEGLESHAYAFIHTNDIRARLAEQFGDEMQFDVIVGNPPYQIDDGGFRASAAPIYNRFVDQAKLLEPRLLTMVIPARWFSGGKGLDGFRKSMLEDRRMRTLVDYPDSRDCFQGVDVAGGICYFLWDRDNEGDCKVVSNLPGESPAEVTRPLLEPGASVFLRYNQALPILRKVVGAEAPGEELVLPEAKRFARQVSSQKPFGLRTFFRGTSEKQSEDDVLVLQSGGRAWAARSEISVGIDLIDKWKVFTSKSSSEHAGQVDKSGKRRVLSLTGVLPPGSVVTETYVLIGAYDTEEEARNCLSYVTTNLFRFLIAIRSSAQDIAKAAYSFIPLQDFTESWDDEKLYAKYGITDEEIAFVEKLIRPMDLADG